ncbi:hypothetical protein [Chryseobacterium sp. MP_3.2]|uniref:hypothetical protein n=1 Tax=Chryseobacterium sp. MP_3.2 TaxID=3071712 RepID=UPI002E0BB4E1|nr:hypothetical protein [Chryseobacterium sp. MP_3.2]
MDRNSNILKIIFFVFAINICFLAFKLFSFIISSSNNQNEYPDALPDYYIPLKEAVGRYIYIPYKNKEYGIDDYKYLNLKKGDTLTLEIKADSTFIFNYFYHDKAIKSKNFKDKFTTYPSYKNILILKKYPDSSQYHGGTSGFKKGEKTYFYLRLKSPNDDSEYEYNLYYEKIK